MTPPRTHGGTTRPGANTRRAVALLEVLALCVVLAAVAAILALAAHDSRRRSRQGSSIDNLRFFASGTQSYAADNGDRFASYTWTAGPQSTEYPDLNFAADNLQATLNQAVYLIRSAGETPQFNPVHGWLPQVYQHHLPLLHHLGVSMIARVAVSPEDAQRQAWQRGAEAFRQSSPRPTGAEPAVLRWIYTSSYEFGPAFWCADSAVIVDGLIRPTLTQAGIHYQYNVPVNMTFGQRRLDEVRFPASKAQMWDRYQRDLGSRLLYFPQSAARVPVLCVDGSAGLRAGASTNYGFNPAVPLSPAPTSFAYQPGNWEPATTTGAPSETVIGRMRWTRWGLRGRDFNGPEATAP